MTVGWTLAVPAGPSAEVASPPRCAEAGRAAQRRQEQAAVGKALLLPDNPALIQQLSLRPLLEPETMLGAVAVAARERGITSFQTPRIVCAAGMVPYQDRLLLTFGIDDSSSRRQSRSRRSCSHRDPEGAVHI